MKEFDIKTKEYLLEQTAYSQVNEYPAMSIEVRNETQLNSVEDEVSALNAVIRPILQGTLYALKQEVLKDYGGIEKILLRQLARAYKVGDGDIGICFEYAVHDSIINKNSIILDRIETALAKHCKIKGDGISSILFGAEKNGTIQLIKSVKEHLTSDSKLLAGAKGPPVLLKRHIDSVTSAFRKKEDRNNLPSSIAGLWKADLFIGKPNPDKWVGTTVKINADKLEGAKGLRLGIVPTKQGENDAIKKDDTKNLIIIPMPYDKSFMEIFYRGWYVVKNLLSKDAQMPPEKDLFLSADRFVCKWLVDRREFSVKEVIEALLTIQQPSLLESENKSINVFLRKDFGINTNTIIAPISNQT